MTPDISSAVTARQQTWANGFRPVAIYNAVLNDDKSGKRPYGDDWRTRALQDPPAAVTEQANPDHLNTGILCDGLRAVDIDIDDDVLSAEIRAIVEFACGETIVRTRSTSGRCLLVYRAASGEPRKRVVKGTAGKVEFLGAGQQFVAFGGHHSGAALEWPKGGPDVTPRDSLPAVTEEDITRLSLALTEMVGGIVQEQTAKAPGTPAPSSQGATADPMNVLAALAVIPNSGVADWEEWNRIGMAVWSATGGSQTGFAAWCAWSERNEAHDPAECEERWAHYWKSPPTSIGAGTLFHLAKQARPDWRKPTEAAEDRSAAADFPDDLPPEPEPAARHAAPAAASGVPAEPSVNEENEDAVASGFAADLAGTLVFDHSAGQWYVWDAAGGVWRRDDTGRAFTMVRLYCRQVRALFGNTDKKLASVSFWSAVERAAKYDPRLATTADAWDTDPWLLGVPGGVVDLRTGHTLPADPKYRISKQTLVAPAEPGTPAPLWDSFMQHATGGDAELIAFLYRLCGYCLSGVTIEEIIAFVYGLSGTGKGTLFGALLSILGGYAVQTSASTFAAESKVNKEYQAATMAGARFVMASETKRGVEWDESLLKELSGNEGPIPARLPYGKPFTYRAQFKIVITGNNAPILRGYSDSMERRLRVTPFRHKPARKDTSLKERLIAEYPAILRRFIDGGLVWQRDGLGTCTAVAEASRAYFADQDASAAWANERLAIGDGYKERRADLYNDFVTWARAQGEPVPQAREFYESLRQSLGLRDLMSSGVRYMIGAGLRSDGAGAEFPEVNNSDVVALIH